MVRRLIRAPPLIKAMIGIYLAFLPLFKRHKLPLLSPLASAVLVFVNWRGKRLTKSGIERFLLLLKDKAGVTGVRVSAHTFRHTLACTYMENGGEIYKLSRLMGHSSVEVTEEYLKVFNLRAARKNQEQFSAVSTLDLLSKRKCEKVH